MVGEVWAYSPHWTSSMDAATRMGLAFKGCAPGAEPPPGRLDLRLGGGQLAWAVGRAKPRADDRGLLHGGGATIGTAARHGGREPHGLDGQRMWVKTVEGAEMLDRGEQPRHAALGAPTSGPPGALSRGYSTFRSSLGVLNVRPLDGFKGGRLADLRLGRLGSSRRSCSSHGLAVRWSSMVMSLGLRARMTHTTGPPCPGIGCPTTRCWSTRSVCAPAFDVLFSRLCGAGSSCGRSTGPCGSGTIGISSASRAHAWAP